jgi:hypothetical protein
MKFVHKCIGSFGNRESGIVNLPAGRQGGESFGGQLVDHDILTF